MHPVESLDVKAVRRLALARAGLLKPQWSGFPSRALKYGGGQRARKAALEVIERFGYLQLDTVSIAGARSHTIVLLSRLEGFERTLGEELLGPAAGLFEYWGHEVSWIPIELYPAFQFRRRAYREHPWWGDLIAQYPAIVKQLRRRVRRDGPLRALDMEGRGSRGWWDLKPARRVASALWSSGEFAIRERRNFQRTFDLRERVIPADVLERPLKLQQALGVLLLRALDGHGWATTGTLASTWRLRNMQPALKHALARLEERREIVACRFQRGKERPRGGWIRPADLELAERLRRVRPVKESGVLLSPFDPLLWDRTRVAELFDFDQKLEVFKPALQRTYGYYCLPVLAGERLVARLDLKAERKKGVLEVLSARYEGTGTARAAHPEDSQAVRSALERFARAVELEPRGLSGPAVASARR